MKRYAQSRSSSPKQVQLRRGADGPAYKASPVASLLSPAVESHRDNPEVRNRLAAIQMRRRGQSEVGAQTTDEVHALANEGIAGSGSALPHRAIIQKSFGHHDISGVQSHTDSKAARATESLGARGYATGDHVAFASQPDLHLAAHEAAHVVQQRAGVHLKGGIGSQGDMYERHADAVADRVVAGQSASDLLDGLQSGSSGSGLQFSAAPGGKEDGPTPAKDLGDKGPVAADEVPPPARKAVEERARIFGGQGRGWDKAAPELTRLLGPRVQGRDTKNVLQAFAHPGWLAGIEKWMNQNLRAQIHRAGEGGKSWNEIWLGLERSVPKSSVPGGWDIEPIARGIWENEQGDSSDQSQEAAVEEGDDQQKKPNKPRGFDPDESRSWRMSPFQDTHKVVSGFPPARELVPHLQRGFLGLDGTKGPKAVVRIGKPGLAKVGPSSVAFVYRHDGGDKVTPVIYDFAPRPSPRNPKLMEWTYAGPWEGAPAAP